MILKKFTICQRSVVMIKTKRVFGEFLGICEVKRNINTRFYTLHIAAPSLIHKVQRRILLQIYQILDEILKLNR